MLSGSSHCSQIRRRKHAEHFVLLLLMGLTIPTWARNWNAKMDWQATGDGKTDDSSAIQRSVAAMRSGDTVVFPVPGIFFVASTVKFRAPGKRLKCELCADDYDFIADGPIRRPIPSAFPHPFAQAEQPGRGVCTSIRESTVVWHNNFVRGVFNNLYAGIGIEGAATR
jgi:hypothetical protein